jgi:protein SCO1/2
MANIKRIRNIAVPVLIVIILPLLVIILVKQGKNVYKHLPYIGNPVGIAPNGDTIRHTIKSFQFTDQNGQPYGSDSLKGKIYVADFFFTSCTSICPMMTKELKDVVFDQYQTGKHSDEVKIVSFTIDPKRDSPARLLHYAQKFGISGNRWKFLTGPKDSIYKLMGTEGYLMIKPSPEEGSDQITHSKYVDLVDKEGHIRGVFDATDHTELERLRDEIRLLMLQYATKDEPQR